jgi:hypothetical protein
MPAIAISLHRSVTEMDFAQPHPHYGSVPPHFRGRTGGFVLEKIEISEAF